VQYEVALTVLEIMVKSKKGKGDKCKGKVSGIKKGRRIFSGPKKVLL